MKQCSKCKRVLPKSNFYYEKNKDRIKKYRLENKEKIKEWRKNYRQNEHVKQKELEYSAKYRQKNLEKVRARDKRYHQEHKEERKKYYQKNKKRELERGRAWREKNNPERLGYYKEYHKNHLFEHRLHESKRRIKLKSINIEHAFTKEEWEQKIALTSGICPRCNKEYSDGYGLTMDHNPPLSKASTNFVYTIEHIQPLCMSCNSSKGNKMGEHWR